MRQPAVLLDIDGTLLDTNYFHAVAWFRACRGEGIAVRMADVHRHIGMGGERMLAEILPEVDEEVQERLKKAHSEHYASFLGVLERFPDAKELLEEIASRGLQVVLATSAGEKELPFLLSALESDSVISAVTSAGDVERTKPEPDVVEVAMEKAGVDAEHAVMVGDTVWDVLAAHRAGVACIALTSGGISEAELLEAGAAAVYDGVGDLLLYFESSLLGELAAKVRTKPGRGPEKGAGKGVGKGAEGLWEPPQI